MSLAQFKEIRPGKPWWSYDWKEFWDYRHLIFFLVRRDLVIVFKQTILGPLHLIIRPFVTSLLFQLVFNRMAGMSTDGVNPFLFYYANTTAWSFFASVFGSSSGVFVNGKGIMNKVYFPRLITPFASVATNFVNLLIQLFILGLLILWFVITDRAKVPEASALLLFIPLVQLACIGVGVGFLFACMTLRYRDLSSFQGLIVQGLMYLSPVIYPFSMVPEKFANYMKWNPIASTMESFRFLLFGEGTISPQLLVAGWTVTVVLFVAGFIAFNVTERKFVDIV